MSEPSLLWTMTWVSLFFIFLYIIYKENDKKLYLLYFLSGMVFGFYFDIVSLYMGYYSYPWFFPMYVFGIPISMTIAEGFSVVITIKIFQMLMHSVGKFTKKGIR